MIFITGDAGIGKTRLVEEVAAEAETDRHLVAWGRAYERAGAPCGWPWIQVAGELVRRVEPERLRRAARGRHEALRPLIQDLDSLGGEDPADAPLLDPTFQPSRELPADCSLDSPKARFAFFEAVTGFLIDVAETDMLTVVLDDLQWSDQLSLELLEHVAARLHTARILLLATCRPPENHLEKPLTETLGALVRLPTFDWIELDGLTCPDVGRLISQRGARASPAQVSEIHSRTDGNPFFVSTFAELLATRDVPRLHLSGWVPSGVRAVIRRCLTRLPDLTHDLLVIAAAMGRDFDIRKVAAAAHTDVDAAVSRAHSAVVAGLITEDPVNVGVYRFCNALVQDTLRGEIEGLFRCRLYEFANRFGSEREVSDGDHAKHKQEACG
jgi:predicted ATPase